MATLIPAIGTSAFGLTGALKPREAAPIGLFLCAESSREQVELMQIHKDGITVTEYGTSLPPKAELEEKLHAALLDAGEVAIVIGGQEHFPGVILLPRSVAFPSRSFINGF
jgi:hypothetical protein